MVWPVPETAMGSLPGMQLPRGGLTIYTLRDTIIPLVRSEGPPRTNTSSRALRRGRVGPRKPPAVEGASRVRVVSIH